VDSALVKFCRLTPNARIPQYAHADDLAADLYSVEDITVSPRVIALVSTGIALEFPPGFGAVIEDRSGLAVQGVVTLGGVIDPGYRGQIKVILANLTDTGVELPAGSRVAQLRLVCHVKMAFSEVAELSASVRGKRGYGSTGL
jgi:dUTP pyrophosphatase